MMIPATALDTCATLMLYKRPGLAPKWGAAASFGEVTHAAFWDGGRIAGEKNDCTVRALMLVTRLTYEQAHEALRRRCGRKNGHGTWPRHAYAEHGGVFKYAEGRPTLAAVLATLGRGFYILSTKDHVFAVIDGKVIDTHINGARCRVTEIWSFPDPTNGG